MLAYDLGVLITERLTGSGPFTVYRGNVPTTPPGAYVVLYFGGGLTTSHRLGGAPDDLRWSFRAVCAGRSDQQVLNTVDLVRNRLTGWKPQPTDRATGRLNEVDQDAPLLRDDSVANDVRYSLTLLYRLNTNRS